jgi:hypothetical protein
VRQLTDAQLFLKQALGRQKKMQWLFGRQSHGTANPETRAIQKMKLPLGYLR